MGIDGDSGHGDAAFDSLVDRLVQFCERERRRAAFDKGVDRLLVAHRRELRRMSYPAYLRSPAWAILRDAALSHAGDRCERCGASDELAVHHRTYERLRGELPDDLAVLCAACHEQAHRDEPPAQVSEPADWTRYGGD